MQITMKNPVNTFVKSLLPPSLLEGFRVYRSLPRQVKKLQRQLLILAEHSAGKADGTGDDKAGGRSVINAHELQVYSQNGEDGILQYIFSQIGVTNRCFVEFGMGDGRECNTACLSLRSGWQGLLLDGNPSRVAQAQAFYDRMLGMDQQAVQILSAWVTRDNINDLIGASLKEREPDLLSIDMDGNDYWVWQALEIVQPRVVVIEYSAVLGWERRRTTPYDPSFVRWEKHPSGLYAGASLAALAALGATKGYRLVGCNRHGVNAFFVRENEMTEALPEVIPEVAYYACDDLLLGAIGPERFSEIATMPFDDV